MKLFFSFLGRVGTLIATYFSIGGHGQNLWRLSLQTGWTSDDWYTNKSAFILRLTVRFLCFSMRLYLDEQRSAIRGVMGETRSTMKTRRISQAQQGKKCYLGRLISGGRLDLSTNGDGSLVTLLGSPRVGE